MFNNKNPYDLDVAPSEVQRPRFYEKVVVGDKEVFELSDNPSSNDVNWRDYSIQSLISANLSIGEPSQLIPSQLAQADKLYSNIK